MTNINTQDRLFGLLQINPLSVFRSHQVLVLNAYDKYKKNSKKINILCEKYQL